MNATKPKQQTATGKAVAPFTLVVDYKPEYQRANRDTGELYERWTYRSDKENMKYASEKDNTGFENEVYALGYVYQRYRLRFENAKFFDNRKPAGKQLFAEFRNGKIIYPHSSEKQAKVLSWLNSCV